MNEDKDKNTEKPHQEENFSEIESSVFLNADYVAGLLSDRLVILRQDWELGNPPDDYPNPDPDEVPDAPDQIFELFALAGGIMRLDREVLKRNLPETDVKWLMERLPEPFIDSGPNDNVRATWLDAAIQGFPDLEAWRANALMLEEAYESDSEPEQRTTLARCLLSDLDETELVCNMLRDIFSIEKEEHEKKIEDVYELLDWMIDNSSIFVAAGAYVSAMLQSFAKQAEDPSVEKFKAIEKDVQEALEICLFTEPAPLEEEEKTALKDLLHELKQEGKQREQESLLSRPEPAFQSYLDELARRPSKEVEKLTRRPELFPSSSLPSGISGRAVARAASKNKKFEEGPVLDFVPEIEVGKSKKKSKSWTATLKIPLPEEWSQKEKQGRTKSLEEAQDIKVKLWVREFQKPLEKVYLCGITTLPENRGHGLWMAEFSLKELAAMWGEKKVPTLVLETGDGEFLGGALQD